MSEDDVASRLQDRAESMRAWLDQNHGSSLDRRAHLQEGSVASGHWHAGYLSALEDVEALLTGSDAVAYAWDDATED